MKKILSFSILIALFVSVFSQTVTLTFTGRDANNNWVQLDYVVITDLTRNWSETIVWPDTVLTIQNGTGIDTYADNSGLSLSQNTPNPFKEQTIIQFKLAEDAKEASICIFDMTGKTLKKMPISSGMDSVSIGGYELGEGMFLYSLIVDGQEIDTKKMVISK